jgi:tetratricopeptide (TPR) repeat protein
LTSLFSLLALLAISCSGDGSEATTDRTTPPPEAVDAYTRGRRLWETRSAQGLNDSLTLFEEALTLHPDYAAAWAGLADSSCLLGLYALRSPAETMPKARAAARRALELDPSLAAAWASLGLTQYLFEWDWAAAETSFRRALELDADHATVYHWYAMLLTATGRHDEAVTTMDRALSLAPQSPIINVKRGTVLTAAARFDEAEAQLRASLSLFPEAPLAHRELGFLDLRRAHFQDALASFERAAQLQASAFKSSGGLAYTYARLGRTQEARTILTDFLRRADSSFVPPMYIALMYVGLGETDQAFAWLEQAYRIRDPGLVYLLVKPGFESLSEDPRFHDLASRIGLQSTDQESHLDQLRVPTYDGGASQELSNGERAP